jgi:hypothetical protein
MVARLDGLFAYAAERTVAGQPSHELVFSVHNGWNFKAGDTSGLVADASGVFHPVWIDNRTGFSQVWTAPVRVSGSVHRVRDVTSATTVRLANARYDATTRIVSVDATLEVRVPIRGPISLQATSLASGITDHITALDSFNGIGGEGAVWVVVEQGRLLSPGETVSRTLRFSLGEWSRAAINPLAVTVRVLASEGS